MTLVCIKEIRNEKLLLVIFWKWHKNLFVWNWCQVFSLKSLVYQFFFRIHCRNNQKVFSLLHLDKFRLLIIVFLLCSRKLNDFTRSKYSVVSYEILTIWSQSLFMVISLLPKVQLFILLLIFIIEKLWACFNIWCLHFLCKYVFWILKLCIKMKRREICMMILIWICRRVWGVTEKRKWIFILICTLHLKMR